MLDFYSTSFVSSFKPTVVGGDILSNTIYLFSSSILSLWGCLVFKPYCSILSLQCNGNLAILLLPTTYGDTSTLCVRVYVL